MERLVKHNYFDHRRNDEDKMVKVLGFSDDVVEEGNVGIDFSDFKTVHTACLNFGKDRFDVLRCNFLNYRRNVACFHCDCKHPADEFIENKMQEKLHDSRMRLEKIASRPEVSNAWNFNFDDDKSDGADVAAFKYAYSLIRGEDSPLGSLVHEDGFNKVSRYPRFYEREHSGVVSNRPGLGFDYFDNEDDVDSYEIDIPRKASSNDFSEVEGFPAAEDKGSNSFLSRRRATPSYNGRSRPMHGKAGFSGSEDDELGFDTDEELSVQPKWKSSQVADSRHRKKGGCPTGSSRGSSFGSDEESGLDSVLDGHLVEDFRSGGTKGKKPVSGRRFQRNGSDMEDDSFSGSETDSDDLHWFRNRTGENKMESGRTGKTFEGCCDYKFVRYP